MGPSLDSHERRDLWPRWRNIVIHDFFHPRELDGKALHGEGVTCTSGTSKNPAGAAIGTENSREKYIAVATRHLSLISPLQRGCVYDWRPTALNTGLTQDRKARRKTRDSFVPVLRKKLPHSSNTNLLAVK